MKFTVFPGNKLLLTSPHPKLEQLSLPIHQPAPRPLPPPAATFQHSSRAVQLLRSSSVGSRSVRIMQNVSGRVGCKTAKQHQSVSGKEANRGWRDPSVFTPLLLESFHFSVSLKGIVGWEAGLSIFKVKYRKCKRLWSVFDSLFSVSLFSLSLFLVLRARDNSSAPCFNSFASQIRIGKKKGGGGHNPGEYAMTFFQIFSPTASS